MKFILVVIFCSGLEQNCLPPYKYPDLFVDGYSCMIAGNYESILKLEELGHVKVNDNKIYIKFMCTEDKKEKVNT